MPWYQTIFEVIDMRSFSNLWYWIGLAVFWATLGHWVMGVPHDMIRRAPSDPETLAGVEGLAAIYTRRLLSMTHSAGLWLVAVLAFLLSMLGLLAILYRVEFAQALLCMALPACLVLTLTLRTAHKIAAGDDRGAALLQRLIWHRRSVQLLGMVSIFLTAVYGMTQNLLFNLYG